MRIYKTQKRAQLLKEWLLACYSNNECYYDATLYTGIPDGDSYEDVLDDLRGGYYDEDIDDMIYMYVRVRALYADDGWYIGHKLYNTMEEALEAIPEKIPEKIYAE